MSFSFGFDLEADDALAFSTASLSMSDRLPELVEIIPAIPHKELPLVDLIASLPPLISFTPLSIPLTSPTTSSRSSSRTLFRRDLFDARFQVMTQEEADEGLMDEEAFIEKNDKGKGKEMFVDEGTDLVKGVYEGGLKTWECSLDLVDCLDGLGYGSDAGEDRVRGKNIVELGCGTALPTCSLFLRLLQEIQRASINSTSASTTELPPRTRIHLQDYNHQVLSLITLPNILLAFAQHITRPVESSTAKNVESVLPMNREVADEEDDSDRPGELEVTPELLESFESLLLRENIELRFFEGDWSSMVVEDILGGREPSYDIVLTSETIYSLPSLPSLLSLLQSASTSTPASTQAPSLCLVACKRIYFGVGGGELEFKRRVNEMGAAVETIWGHGKGEGRSQGVGRVVMNVDWSASHKAWQE